MKFHGAKAPATARMSFLSDRPHEISCAHRCSVTYGLKVPLRCMVGHQGNPKFLQLPERRPHFPQRPHTLRVRLSAANRVTAPWRVGASRFPIARAVALAKSRPQARVTGASRHERRIPGRHSRTPAHRPLCAPGTPFAPNPSGRTAVFNYVEGA